MMLIALGMLLAVGMLVKEPRKNDRSEGEFHFNEGQFRYFKRI